MKHSVANALKELRQRAGLSIRKTADAVGMPQSSYRHYENPDRFKSRFLPVEVARDLANLFATRGIPESEVMELAGVPRVQTLQALEPLTDGEVALPPMFTVYAHDREPELFSIALPTDYLKILTRAPLRSLCAVKAKGDSMSPTFLDGDMALIDRGQANPEIEGLYAVDLGSGPTIKRLGHAASPGRVTVISDNRALYPAIEVDTAKLVVIGRVIWFGRKT